MISPAERVADVNNKAQTREDRYSKIAEAMLSQLERQVNEDFARNNYRVSRPYVYSLTTDGSPRISVGNGRQEEHFSSKGKFEALTTMKKDERIAVELALVRKFQTMATQVGWKGARLAVTCRRSLLYFLNKKTIVKYDYTLEKEL